MGPKSQKRIRRIYKLNSVECSDTELTCVFIAVIIAGNDCVGTIVLYYCLFTPAVSALYRSHIVFIW